MGCLKNIILVYDKIMFLRQPYFYPINLIWNFEKRLMLENFSKYGMII